LHISLGKSCCSIVLLFRCIAYGHAWQETGSPPTPSLISCWHFGALRPSLTVACFRSGPASLREQFQIPRHFSRHKSRCLPDVATVNDFYLFLPTMRIFYTESSFATLTCLKCFGTFLPTRRKFFTYSQENIAKRCCISKNTTYTENLLHSGFF
jgi:hypothetical protein